MFEDRIECGSFMVKKNDDDQLYWSGGCSGDKDETNLEPGEPLGLSPNGFKVGTIVICYEPE